MLLAKMPDSNQNWTQIKRNKWMNKTKNQNPETAIPVAQYATSLNMVANKYHQ